MNDITMETKNSSKLFTYHQKSGYVGFILAMIAVAIVEMVGVSFLLYRWSPVLHWVHLVISIMLVVLLVVDVRGVVKNPIMIENGKLFMKIGIRPEVHIDTENIKEIKSGKVNYENDRKSKDVLDLSLLGFEEPTFEIVLVQPIENRKKPINRIFVTVDDKEEFYQAIQRDSK